MKQGIYTITENRPLTADVWEMKLLGDTSSITAPGQFINIKLDMEVVWDYFREKDVLLPAIVTAFKQLQLSITAEGIETKDMAEAMKEIGCDFLQGYYFSKPLPIPEFVEKYGK